MSLWTLKSRRAEAGEGDRLQRANGKFPYAKFLLIADHGNLLECLALWSGPSGRLDELLKDPAVAKFLAGMPRSFRGAHEFLLREKNIDISVPAIARATRWFDDNAAEIHKCQHSENPREALANLLMKERPHAEWKFWPKARALVFGELSANDVLGNPAAAASTTKIPRRRGQRGPDRQPRKRAGAESKVPPGSPTTDSSASGQGSVPGLAKWKSPTTRTISTKFTGGPKA